MPSGSDPALPPRRPWTAPIWNGAPSRTVLPPASRPSSARARGFLSSAQRRCRGGAEARRAPAWLFRLACDIAELTPRPALHSPTNIETSWPNAIYAHFQRVGIRQVGYVPDAGHSRLITLCKDDPNIAAGAQGAALFMQSSGVGNCVNMFSLLRNCGFGCVVVVTMRGEFGEFNPWQVPMGTITGDVLRLARFLTYGFESADAVDDIVGAGCDMPFDGNLQVAILLSQRLIGRKQWTR